MKNITLAPQESCTACGACMQACAKGCITMRPDGLDCAYPVIDRQRCVGCGRCMAVCPALNPCGRQELQKVYAAWNTDEQVRLRAASGGIASAIYQYALSRNIKTFGVRYTPGQKAEYIEIRCEQDIAQCRNSKYVYSDISMVLKPIKAYLDQGETVILPALPCQIGAVLSYIGGRHERLLLVDIVCHGVCPAEYLNQHIAAIEEKKKKKAQELSFREPAFGTDNYVFALRNNNGLLYHAYVHRADVYQLGYHKALNYRENCYHCQYAEPKRLGDLTISDFSGLGRIAPYAGPRPSVSCVIVSSAAGARLWEALQKDGLVECEARPQREALDYERQLQAPSVPHKNRKRFKEHYQESKQYEAAARKALEQDIMKNHVRNFLHVEQLKICGAKLLPKKVKQFLKKLR